MDKMIDITCHPLYTSLGSDTSRTRGRSVPTHRLNMDLASDLTLEAESMAEPARHIDETEQGTIFQTKFVSLIDYLK